MAPALCGACTVHVGGAATRSCIGKGVPTVDLDDLCNGRGTFGMDLKVPGMVYASIERPPGRLRRAGVGLGKLLVPEPVGRHIAQGSHARAA